MTYRGKTLILMISILAFTALVSGCGSGTSDDELTQVLYDQLDFLRNEDIDGVLSTMDPSGPQYEQTKSVMEQIFELYDLEYEVESLEVIEKSDTEAKLRAVQTIRKVSGPELADTRTTAVHTLRKTDDGWKLYESDAESTETIDQG